MIAKQLINVAGALVVLGALLAGVLLAALPLFLKADQTHQAAATVEQGNVVYDAQVQSLRADAARFDAISADVAELREQIPADAQSDDVFEIVGAAAAETGVTVVSVAAVDPETWTEPAAADSDQQDAAATVPEEAAASTPAPAPSAPPGAEPGAEPAPDAESPRTQVPFSIAVQAADPAQAVAFIDALGRGPRLVSIEHAALSPTTDGYDLTVAALTFVRLDG
ncbi:hypothetical protein RYJ27_04280 [Microbacterium limosum]|uniref:Tfp pilus assembly protein PilO n=1 Tax=Microbacterium limosum TaxID=3079935 RepID=A0AAU0MIY6_9MICO|nr:hypothetical protein [Microbacterium sp. Y20]WOQ70433.1 hypothetical protein RYJ27_04280 [Microbacterium sp. Y20]